MQATTSGMTRSHWFLVLPDKGSPLASLRGASSLCRSKTFPSPCAASSFSRVSFRFLVSTLTRRPGRSGSPIQIVARHSLTQLASSPIDHLQLPVPAPCGGRVDAVGDGAEPGLHAGERGEVVCLLGGIGGGAARALGHEAR